MTHQKRLSAPKHYPIERKQQKYVTTIKGSRSVEDAIPVTLFLRDVMEYAESEKEVKEILKNGKIKRNGETLRDSHEGIGILDVVEIEGANDYRVLKDGKDLEFVPVDDSEKVIARIEDRSVEGDEYVYRLHSGENYRTKDDYSTGSSLLFNDSVEEIEMGEGATVLVTSGQHAGEVAELKEINRRKMDPSTGRVESGFEFETQLENLVPVKDVELGDR